MTGPDEPQGTPAEPDGAAEAPAPEETGPPRCRECDAVLDEQQTYCLECGAPTPLAPGLRRRGGMGALAAGLAVLGVGAGFLGYAVASDGGDGTRPPTVLTAVPPPVTTPSTIDTTGLGTGPLPPDPSGTTPTNPDDGTSTDFVTTTSGSTAPGTPLPGTGSTAPTDTGGGLPADTTGSLPGTTADTATSPSEPPDTADPTSDWPAGTSAWTAVVASAEDADAARQERSRARAAGFGAGILISDDHPNLSPGLYVVYIGVYGSRGRAVAMAGRARASFPGAYARYVES